MEMYNRTGISTMAGTFLLIGSKHLRKVALATIPGTVFAPDDQALEVWAKQAFITRKLL